MKYRDETEIVLNKLSFNVNPREKIGIVGRTGSGKSTTLYSMLSELDRETKNVLSLEDPVEYNMEGVSQSQMRPEIGYTFATGLRTTLRQDPDVIMVGEIRDKEGHSPVVLEPKERTAEGFTEELKKSMKI